MRFLNYFRRAGSSFATHVRAPYLQGLRALAAGSLLVLAACGGTNNGSMPPPASDTGSGTIGTSGGTVATGDGVASAVFPANAFSANTDVTIAPSTTAPANARLVPGTAFDFGPSGAFAQPVQLTLKYDPANLPAGALESHLAMYTVLAGAWQPVPGSTVDTTAHTVTASVSHFTPFAVFANSQFAGSYRGTYSGTGGTSGNWQAVIDMSGNVVANAGPFTANTTLLSPFMGASTIPLSGSGTFAGVTITFTGNFVLQPDPTTVDASGTWTSSTGQNGTWAGANVREILAVGNQGNIDVYALPNPNNTTTAPGFINSITTSSSVVAVAVDAAWNIYYIDAQGIFNVCNPNPAGTSWSCSGFTANPIAGGQFIALDGQGNAFVTSQGSASPPSASEVLKFSAATGPVTTKVVYKSLNPPTFVFGGIAVGSDGTLYVTERMNPDGAAVYKCNAGCQGTTMPIDITSQLGLTPNEILDGPIAVNSAGSLFLGTANPFGNFTAPQTLPVELICTPGTSGYSCDATATYMFSLVFGTINPYGGTSGIGVDSNGDSFVAINPSSGDPGQPTNSSFFEFPFVGNTYIAPAGAQISAPGASVAVSP